MKRTIGLFLVLALAGATWGATLPLAKMAVSEGYRFFGILFWQTVLGALVLGGITFARGKPLPLGRVHLKFYGLIAAIGTVLPGISSFSAAVYLPAGVLSMLLSSVPMFAFPVALLMGNDTFSWRRLLGLGFGFFGVCLLVLPDSSLPDVAAAVWIPIALISAIFYSIEGNIVARWGTFGLDAIQVLAGASVVGAMITLPLALVSGQWISPTVSWGGPEWAILCSSLLHAGAYTSYVWLVGQAGSVFAVQVSYLVTVFGVSWAMLFLNEAYSPYFWTALCIMLAGLFFVQPRPRSALVQAAAIGKIDPRPEC